jgi:hypothetical protein
MADFVYRRDQMSAGNIDSLLDIWAASLFELGGQPPCTNHNDVYRAIDSIPLGDVPWQNFKTRFNGQKPQGHTPLWMEAEYEVWFRDPRTVIRNMLANPDFDGEIDFAPLQEFDDDGERQFQDFMSGDWAWQQAVSSCEY